MVPICVNSTVIASEPVFSWQTSAISKSIKIGSNLPYAPKRVFICVSDSETSFGKDRASATFLFQLERVHFPSVIQTH